MHCLVKLVFTCVHATVNDDRQSSYITIKLAHFRQPASYFFVNCYLYWLPGNKWYPQCFLIYHEHVVSPQIVYVAPMKALAAEMTNYFSKRLEPLGIAVKELTGDMQLTKGEILRTQVQNIH